MQRNYLAAMLAALLAVSLVGAGALAAFGSAGAQPAGEETASPADHSIHVSASGAAEAAPDEAVLRVAVTADGDEIGPVRDELATGSAELTDTLDELGVSYETTEYDIREPRFPREDREGPAYRGAHVYEVQVDDPDRVGDVIDAAAGAGAQISHVELTLSDEQRETLRDDAIEAAMADARHQADTIAGTSDLTVTGVATVDASQEQFSPVSYETAREDGAQAGPPTDIATGDVSVTYRVSVTYNATS